MSPSSLMSVVIPTCGRPILLRRCLEALLRQSLPASAFDIIVVDDGRSPATQAVVLELSRLPGAPRMHYVVPPGDQRGPASARNRGWRASTAALIAFTDDDTIPDSGWLESGMRALTLGEGPQRGAAWGQVVVPIPPVPTDHEKMTKGLEGAVFVTANAFVRRSALEKVGGFDERYKRAWREDTDLYFALISHGFKVASAPDAIVEHPARPAPWGICLGQQANAAFEALLFKKYPRLYRQWVQPGVPWLYYGVVVSVLTSLLGLAAGHLALAATLLAGAVLMVTVLAGRRLRGTLHSPAHVFEMIVTSFALPFLSVYWRLRGAVRYRVPFI